MLTERGKPDYPLPEDFGEVVALYLDQREQMRAHYVIRIRMAPEAEMLELHEANQGVIGMPTLAAIVFHRLWFWPTPDDAYNIEAIYAPRHKQF